MLLQIKLNDVDFKSNRIKYVPCACQFSRWLTISGSWSIMMAPAGTDAAPSGGGEMLDKVWRCSRWHSESPCACAGSLPSDEGGAVNPCLKCIINIDVYVYGVGFHTWARIGMGLGRLHAGCNYKSILLCIYIYMYIYIYIYMYCVVAPSPKHIMCRRIKPEHETDGKINSSTTKVSRLVFYNCFMFTWCPNL